MEMKSILNFKEDILGQIEGLKGRSNRFNWFEIIEPNKNYLQ